MALSVNDCVICGEPITKATPFLATSGVAFAPPHPLYPYCDAGMHQQCLLHWPHRKEFSAAYAAPDLVDKLQQTQDWTLFCGPLMYGPNGKPGWPYYAEIRLVDWPIRLYSRFEEWGSYIAKRPWTDKCIPELNERIESLLPGFPPTDQALREPLWEMLVHTMLNAPEYRTRYIATVSLELFDEPHLRSIIPSLQKALSDQHPSVQQAAKRILKRLNSMLQ